MIKTILTFLIVFSILVIFHEFGHYYFAKKSGILVREFALGMGPKLFSYRKNQTTFTVRMLPLGGYVRMAGYEEESELRPGTPVGLVLNDQNEVIKINLNQKKPLLNAAPLEVTSADLEKTLVIEGYLAGNNDDFVRYNVKKDALIIEEDGTEVQIAPIDVQFQSASLPQRMMTNFAGPMNNLILAIVVFIIFAFVQGGVYSSDSQIGEVMPNSPAEEVGLTKGDLVTAINGTEVGDWQKMVSIIQKNPDKEITLSVEHESGEMEEVQITPEAGQTTDGEKTGMIGVQAMMKTGFFDKIVFGFSQTWMVITSILSVLGSMFTKGFSVDMFGGPVAIYATTETVVSAGLLGILNWMAFLSINLGIVNLLPIPALDGGKLVLNIIEGVRGKPLSEEKEGLVTLIGAGLLVVLMVLVTWNDIQRYFF